MIATATVLFLIAAVGGLIMAARIFRGGTPPTALALGHGALAATALVLTLYAVLTTPAPDLARYGAGILVVAALGGFFLASFHMRQKAHPKAVVVLHGALAVTGVACLGLTLL